jgi:SAM-dependent methyltransferase
MAFVCRICRNAANNASYAVREMMFGSREEFSYFQCSKCDCLQAAAIPSNMEKYYPSTYYSYAKLALKSQGGIKRFLKRERARYYLDNKGLVGHILSRLLGDPNFPLWVKPAGIHPDSAVLDIGSGAGELLFFLYSLGLSKLTGFDRYIPSDFDYGHGVKVLKRGISEPSNSFDCVMFHHSFEHFPNQLETLREIRDKLVPKGTVIIRIPTVSSFAWRHYKTNWVQLDAPRHLYLHSVRSMELCAEQGGFSIEKVFFDSTEFQFWGSEQYVKGISLTDQKSYRNGIEKSIFSNKDIEEFRRKAASLNESNEGDQACFILRKLEE